MSDIDRSQHGEQKIVLEFFKGQTGRFLDLGAFDGITNSNTRALSDLGWRGVCVEASPETFIKLVANHKGNPNIVCVNAAMQPHDKPAHLFLSKEPQLNSCLSETHLREWASHDYWVGGITAKQIAEQFGGSFDFVSLDIEGIDLQVLATMGPILKDTRLLCIEDCIPMDPFNQHYYDLLLVTAASFGLRRVVARTAIPSGNTLLARE